MAKLKVSDAGDGLLEVVEAGTGKWWSVSEPNSLGDRLITTPTLRVVSTDGPLGRRILAAVAEYESQAAS